MISVYVITSYWTYFSSCHQASLVGQQKGTQFCSTILGLTLCVQSTSCLSESPDRFQNLHFYLRSWKLNGCLSWLQMSISGSQEVQSRKQLLSNQHFNIMVPLIFYHGWSTDQEPVVIGALEAIKMNSPFPGDRGLEIVARCSLLVNRLLEGRIIQQCKTAKDYFFLQ